MANCNFSENPLFFFSWFKPKMPNPSYGGLTVGLVGHAQLMTGISTTKGTYKKGRQVFVSPSCGCVLRQLPLSATKVMVLLELVPIYGIGICFFLSSTSFIMPKGSMVNELALVYSVQIMPHKIQSYNDWHMLVFVKNMWQCFVMHNYSLAYRESCSIFTQGTANHFYFMLVCTNLHC